MRTCSENKVVVLVFEASVLVLERRVSLLDRSLMQCDVNIIGVARIFDWGGPVNFHRRLRLPWTTLVTVRADNNRH